jgi:hypothetical protein
MSRIHSSRELHDSWESVFRCSELHAKYCGTAQWLEEEDPESDKYYVNLFFAGVETKKPSLVFSVPRFIVKSRPSRADDVTSTTTYRAKLYQDTINTIAPDRRVGFLSEALLALHESFFRFGVVEVGITGDVVDNPRAGKPMLADDGTKLTREGDLPVHEPETLIVEEHPYVKWIPASQFLVSTSNKNALERNDWVGYYEYVRVEDIRANPAYDPDVRKRVKAGGHNNDQGSPSSTPGAPGDSPEASATVCLYKVWDLRAKVRRVFCEGTEGFLLKEPFKVLPLAVHRVHPILGSFYPVPPTFNWLPQQREINDTREMQRAHRKRSRRRFTLLDAGVDPAELDKLESGEDGVYARVPRHDVIAPMQDAPLDRAIYLSAPATFEDFMRVSGVSGERQGVQEAETATQANIIDTNERLRESFTQQLTGDWVAQIATKLLLVLIEKGSLPFWIKTNVDFGSEGSIDEAGDIAVAWKMIQRHDLDIEDAFNYELSVELDTLSPAVQERRRNDLMVVLQTVVNPAYALHFLASDHLLRRFLAAWDITDEADIVEIRKAMHMVQLYMTQRDIMAAMGMVLPVPLGQTSGAPTPTGVPKPLSNGAPVMPGMGGPQGPFPGPTPSRSMIADQLEEQL